MRVQIRSIEDKGNLSLERIVFRVEREVDIGDFMLVRTAFEGGHVTTEVMNTFWFPDKSVNGGDIATIEGRISSIGVKNHRRGTMRMSPPSCSMLRSG